MLHVDGSTLRVRILFSRVGFCDCMLKLCGIIAQGTKIGQSIRQRINSTNNGCLGNVSGFDEFVLVSIHFHVSCVCASSLTCLCSEHMIGGGELKYLI